MIIPLVMLAALSAPPLISLPDGFKAQCRSVSDAYVNLMEAPTKGGRLMQDVMPDSTSSIDITKDGGQFSVYTGGADVQMVAHNGPDFKIVVLKDQLGDLVLSVSTSTIGASTTIYHLRYRNHIGAMTVSRVSYYGFGPDETSLEDFRCTSSL